MALKNVTHEACLWNCIHVTDRVSENIELLHSYTLPVSVFEWLHLMQGTAATYLICYWFPHIWFIQDLLLHDGTVECLSHWNRSVIASNGCQPCFATREIQYTLTANVKCNIRPIRNK